MLIEITDIKDAVSDTYRASVWAIPYCNTVLKIASVIWERKRVELVKPIAAQTDMPKRELCNEKDHLC